MQLEGWIKTAPAFLDGGVFRRKSTRTTFRAQRKAYICSGSGLGDLSVGSALDLKHFRFILPHYNQ